jgi:hypothetical protein
MKSFIWILFGLVPSILFSQSDSTILRNMPSGAYDTYQNFIYERPVMNGEAVLSLIGRSSDGNQILLPSKDFGNFFGLVLNGSFYLNHKHETKKMKINNYAILAASVAMNTLNPNYRVFARVIKFGTIGLTSLNSCFKFPSKITNSIFINQISNYIKDDKELFKAFRKSKNKETEMYRFIELYNKSHPVFKIDK